MARLRALSAEMKPRDEPTRGNRDTTMTDPDGEERQFEKLDAELAARRATLPEGTEPCDLGAWSWDRDPKGLNVRAEPSAKSRVLGTLPPPYRLKMGGSENTPEGGWLTEFRIIGFKDGWFLIEGATPPGKEYEDEKRYPRNAPKPYARARLGRRQQGRRQLRQRRHAHGRTVPGAVRRCEVDAGRAQARRRARYRRRTETHSRLQRALGPGGKRGRRARLVAQPVLQPGDELQLTAACDAHERRHCSASPARPGDPALRWRTHDLMRRVRCESDSKHPLTPNSIP